MFMKQVLKNNLKVYSKTKITENDAEWKSFVGVLENIPFL